MSAIEKVVVIDRVSEHTQEETGQLLDAIFPEEIPSCSVSVRASLGSPERESVLTHYEILTLEFFVARIERVIGTVAFYTFAKDEHEALWIGWLGVDPQYRRQGIAKRLLEFAMTETQRRRKRFLRLDVILPDTHTHAEAERLYETCGFRLTRIGQTGTGKVQKFYEYDLFSRTKI